MKFDVCIAGAGIVGLATGYQLKKDNPDLSVVILEKENSVGSHQTGHNSGVIHSGIYYKPGSLKAKNCIDGYHMLVDYCESKGIPFELCGKVIVATVPGELSALDTLYERGLQNGLEGLVKLNSEQIREIEPHCQGIMGIKVPQTGIINYLAVCQELASDIKQMGGEVLTGQKVVGLEKKDNRVEVMTSQQFVECDLFINCAGLYSDKVALLNEKSLDTRIIPFRGEYYQLKEESKHLVKHLIYPVPDPNFPFLGVHFTRMIDGAVEAGPNAVFAWKREGYGKTDFDLGEFWESLTWPGFRKVATKYWKTGLGEIYRSFSKKAFTKALQKLIPEIKESDLEPAPAGVRAQACDRTGGLLDDFKIVERSQIIHVLNAPSPAATSSLSIGKTVSEMALKQLSKNS
jgi:L-2-hydroxyglutarate oxidase